MKYVGACHVLPLNSMVEAAPQLHGYVNSCQYTVSNLPLRGSEGHLNLWCGPKISTFDSHLTIANGFGNVAHVI